MHRPRIMVLSAGLAITALLPACDGSHPTSTASRSAQSAPSSTAQSGTATNRPAETVPVLVSSQRGSTIVMTLPPGWRQKGSTLTTTTFVPESGDGTVTVTWAPSLGTTSASVAATAALTNYARARGATVKYACESASDPTTTTPTSIFVAGEYPCGRSGAQSMFLTAAVPVQPAPATGRRTLAVHTFAAVNAEEWSIAYDAGNASADKSVTAAVKAARVHITRGPVAGYMHLTDATTTAGPLPVPAQLGAPAVPVPTTALAGAGVKDPCQLVGPTDLAGVSGVTSQLGVSPKTTATGRSCTQTLALPPTALGVQRRASVEVALVAADLTRSVSTLAASSHTTIRGASSSVAGVGAFEAVAFARAAPYQERPATFLAAGPRLTAVVTAAGSADSTTGWERSVIEAQAAKVAQRLRSGSLRPTTPPNTKPSKGLTTDGVRYGRARDHTRKPCELVTASSTTRLAGSSLSNDTTFPPTCASKKVDRLFATPLLEYSIYNGSLVSSVDTTLGPSRSDHAAATQTVNGLTVYTTQIRPRREGLVSYAGTLLAFIGINEQQYVWLTVRYRTHADYTKSEHIRTAVVADLTKRAAVGN